MSSGLTSLKRSLDQVERYERLFRSALECFLSLIHTVDQHTLAIEPELEHEFHQRLSVIQKTVKADPEEGVLTESRRVLEQDLEEHARRSVGLFQDKTGEVRRIVLILAEATELIQSRTGSYGERFRKIASRLEHVAALDDLGEIRRSLSEQVGELNHGVETMHRDSHEVFVRMRSEMDSIRGRLDEAEKLAETDALTGLLNRRGMERKLETAIAAQCQFCTIIFDLDRFKGINDRYGHLCGDQVLRAFGQRLVALFRPGDAVARWGGDEFLALIPCDVRDSLARSRRIAQSACGTYVVNVEGRELRVEVSASVGVSEHKPGQALKDLIAVADRLMYQNKQAVG